MTTTSHFQVSLEQADRKFDVEYDFNQKYKISSCDVYWFKDGGGFVSFVISN